MTACQHDHVTSIHLPICTEYEEVTQAEIAAGLITAAYSVLIKAAVQN